MTTNAARFRAFVAALDELVGSAGSDEARILDQGEKLLAGLVLHDDWLPEEFAKPEPGTYRQYLALDDDILAAAYGPRKAASYKATGAKTTGPLRDYESLFRKAQSRVERRHFAERKKLMYFVKERKKMLTRMGQDPYLDTPG